MAKPKVNWAKELRKTLTTFQRKSLTQKQFEKEISSIATYIVKHNVKDK